MADDLSQTGGASSSVEASYAEAMRLLRDHAGQQDMQRALDLLGSAASNGLTAAGERLAAFHALAANGPGGPRHFDAAFDALAAAAERGSVPAREQLLLLADPAEEPMIPAQVDAGHWHGVRTRINLGRLLASPERRTVSHAPRIRQLNAFATAAECKWVIEASRGHLAPATVFDHASGALIEDPARNNSAVTLTFDQMDVVTEILRTRIAAAVKVPVRAFEPAQILRYEVGQEFVPHVDFLNPAIPGYAEKLARQGQRIATFLIYLNEDFEGGETAFPAIDMKIRLRTGDALFWANLDQDYNPDPQTLHAGLPPTSGEKWVFSQWICERPPIGGT